MVTTEVVNKKDVKAMTEAHVYIGRGSKWGNPFPVSKNQDRATVIEKYERYFKNRTDLLSSMDELVGKKLVCHCSPLPCHGDIIIKYMKGWRLI